MADPLAYFITFTTYGTWLHDRGQGSVNREHNLPGNPFLPANAKLKSARQGVMSKDPYLLDEPKRAVVLSTLLEVAKHRGWKLWAVHVRTNHIHIVVTANPKPEKVMADLKAWASRRLKESFGESPDRTRWTQQGSTKWLNSMEALEASIGYVVGGQGEAMACFDGRKEPA